MFRRRTHPKNFQDIYDLDLFAVRLFRIFNFLGICSGIILGAFFLGAILIGIFPGLFPQ